MERSRVAEAILVWDTYLFMPTGSMFTDTTQHEDCYQKSKVLCCHRAGVFDIIFTFSRVINSSMVLRHVHTQLAYGIDAPDFELKRHVLHDST